MSFSPLIPLNVLCVPTIPTVFDDALSYYEELCRIQYKLNETINAYNVLIDYYNSLDGLLEEMQATMAQVKAEIAALEAEQQRFIAQINQQFSDLENSLESEIQDNLTQLTTLINSEIAKQNQYLNAQLNILNDKIESNNTELRAWVNEQLAEFAKQIPELQNVSVVDPETGKTVPLQQMIDKLYDVVVQPMWNPITGKSETVRDVVRLNSELHKVAGSLTASEYDALHITAGEYDAKHLTALQYDWHANRYLV